MADSADDDTQQGSPGKAAFMGVVLVVMFLCLFVGWKTPETVVRYLSVSWEQLGSKTLRSLSIKYRVQQARATTESCV